MVEILSKLSKAMSVALVENKFSSISSKISESFHMKKR